MSQTTATALNTPEKATSATESKLATQPFFDEMLHDVERFWQAPWRALAAPWERFGRHLGLAPVVPRIDVAKKDGELYVRADLPGIKKEDVAITLEDGALVLQGERNEEKKFDEKDFYRSECSYGSFYRRIPLDFATTPEAVKAQLRDGVLEVNIPIPAQPASTAPRIAIQ